MSLVRTVKRESPFVQLDKEFIGNGKLSLKATGLLTYILSRPDGWTIRMKDIQNRFNDGETSVRSAMKDLMNEGYVNRYRDRNEDGTLGNYIYDVYERPEFNPNFSPKRENQVLVSPKRDYPELDNPELDNHVLNNNDFNNNDFNNNKIKEEEEEKLSHLTELTDFFRQNIDKNSGENYIKSKFAEWMELLPYDVIKKQLDICAEKSGKSWSYVKTALLRLQESNVTTIEQLEQKLVDHKNSNGQKQKPFKGQSKPKRTEIIPDWFEATRDIYQGGAAAEKIENAADPDIEAKKRAIEEKLKVFRK
jgi:DnaD/phage-associated family protein